MQDDLKYKHNVIINHGKYSQVSALRIYSHTLWSEKKGGGESSSKKGTMRNIIEIYQIKYFSL